MPRLFVPTEELAGSEVALRGESHRYLTRVLRFGAGTKVDLFDGRGLEVEATVLRAGSREVTLQLGPRRQVAAAATPPVTLLQGLSRGERMDLVIQKATELGAARVIVVRTERSAVGQQGRWERWNKIAHEAARQCGRPDSLEVIEPVALGDALGMLGPGTTRLVPWEDAAGSAGAMGAVGAVGMSTEVADPERPIALRQAIPSQPSGVDIFIGPEGGLTIEEIGLARMASFRVVTLGPRILRTETAAIAALAVVQSAIGGLG